MKPHVICHAAMSLDGRTLLSRWRPRDAVAEGLFERVYREIGGEAWIVGRVTGAEYARGATYPTQATESFPRITWRARDQGGPWAVILDPQGKIAWGRSEIEGDPILVVLCEDVPDAHLAGLRKDGVSYTFAGRGGLDLPLLLDRLGEEFGIRVLRVEGGGTTNGAFLRAGLIDEISLLLFAAIDGAEGAPSVFNSPAATAGAGQPFDALTLTACRQLERGALWLRYRVATGTSPQAAPL